MKPPLVTTWLLVRFTSNAALLGDLTEGLAQGRSRMWYRRQTLSAMLASLALALTTQRLETFRFVLLAWGGLTLSGPMLSRAIGSQVAMYVIYFVGGLCIGWLVTRLEPSSRAAMVVLCGVSFVIPTFPTLLRLIVDSFENSRFAYIWDELLLIGLVSAGITIGGLLGVRPADPGVLGEAQSS
jgi:hypothetical protein